MSKESKTGTWVTLAGSAAIPFSYALQNLVTGDMKNLLLHTGATVITAGLANMLADDEAETKYHQSGHWDDDIDNYDQRQYAEKWNKTPNGFRTAPPLYGNTNNELEE